MRIGHQWLRRSLNIDPVNVSLTLLPDDDLPRPCGSFRRCLISKQSFHIRVRFRALRTGYSVMSRQPLVLLVPPDRLTGMTTSHHLAGYGLEIIMASGMDEAQRLLRTNRSISVLVIDTDLGQANDGLSLAKSARVSDPGLKVIYTSRMPFRLRETEKVSGAPCVRTPYRPHQLVGVISQLVRRHPTEDVEAYAA